LHPDEAVSHGVLFFEAVQGHQLLLEEFSQV
jgi:hypothetical protein